MCVVLFLQHAAKKDILSCTHRLHVSFCRGVNSMLHSTAMPDMPCIRTPWHVTDAPPHHEHSSVQ